jgi:hypothetical protein
MSELAVSIAVNLLLGALLAGLLLWRRNPDAACLESADAALLRFREQFPDAVGSANVTSDGHGALVTLAAGYGLLERRGRRWNARLLTRSDCRRVRTEDETLVIEFKDFGWPSARLTLADGAQRAEWLARLQQYLDADSPRRAPEVRHA